MSCGTINTDIQRFVENMQAVDTIVNGTETTVITPGGDVRTTLEGYDNQFQAAILGIGWTIVDSFETGATITSRNQALRYAATGDLYRWDGTLPKTVASGSTPMSSGGIGAGSWLLVRAYEFAGVVTPYMFGGILNGTADDTAALQAALNTNRRVIIPEFGKLRITGTVTMPPGTTIEFMGGLGNTTGQLPSSYIIKAAAVSGPAIIMSENCQFIGGGILGAVGNSGNGITVWGNGVYIDRPFIALCGGDGIRVGKDSAYQNCNSFYINKAITCLNGGRGIALHDGFSEATASADANAGKLDSCFSYQNGSHGIYVGRAWWITVMNALTEGNGGWGMFCDDTVVSPDTVARCRYINIFGGDFNEGNSLGSLHFKGYAGNYFHASANQNIARGGVLNNIYGGGGENVNWGQEINRFLTINAFQGETEAAKYPTALVKTVSGSAGDSCGYAVRAGTTDETQPYQIVAAFEAEYKEPNEWMAVLRVRDGNGESDPGQLVRGLVIDPRFKRWYAGADNVWTLGDRLVRFAGIYSTFPTYVNDADAGADGQPMGTVYRTPTSNQLRVRDGTFTGDGVTVINLKSSAGDHVVAQGVINGAGVGKFFVPCSFGKRPTSIAVSGTFKIRNINTNTVIAASTAALSLGASSSQNIAVIEITGLTGSLTDGDVLTLETTGSGSNVQINF